MASREFLDAAPLSVGQQAALRRLEAWAHADTQADRGEDPAAAEVEATPWAAAPLLLLLALPAAQPAAALLVGRGYAR